MKWMSIVLVTFVTIGCSSAPASTPATQTQVVRTHTSSPSQTAPSETDLPPSPTPTELPGEMVVPVDKFSDSIPWLDQVQGSKSFVQFLVFNMRQPPFDDAAVRRAFSFAIDRSEVSGIVRDGGANLEDISPANSLTPPWVIGRDLGSSYDPATAQGLLDDAGYPEGENFPEVVFLVLSFHGTQDNPEAIIARSIINDWQENLAVDVSIEFITDPNEAYEKYWSRMGDGTANIFMVDWLADYEDPHNFLSEMWEQQDFPGYTRLIFEDEALGELLANAEESNDPATRQALYLEAERLITDKQALVIPLFHARWR